MNYYEINEDTARRAKQMRSFDDYCEGSATWQYRNRCDEAAALAEQVKAERCKTAAQREHIDYLLNRYCKVLAEATNKDNEIGTRCPSVMISGGGNFPVAKKEKQIAAWEKNAERYGYADSILNQIRYYAAVVMLINDHPRCGRCKYWKAMRCINPESKMYEFQRFQRADGICKLWEDGSGLFDDEDDSDCKDGEIMTERETAQSAARSYRRAMLGNVYRHFKGATYFLLSQYQRGHGQKPWPFWFVYQNPRRGNSGTY